MRRQVELARTSVDFFITLLYGHLVVIASVAFALTSADRADRPLLLATVGVLGLGPVRRIFAEEPAASGACSRRAPGSPSYWTYLGDSGVRRECVPGVVGPRRSAGQALVLPDTIDAERKMWTMVSRLSRIPYHERASALDAYRISEVEPEAAGGVG
ncbi:hypothetical protein [Streptomyces sp. NBC_01304]|uniref:hypothetical protein n=1 Tax=Streptomyces sp. NBC_01304 TaxID=2903818 RepID=UPI002E103922|nr:hypothetical protein OG430_11385 [Streptomyces sp. NBC_01304]